MSEKNEPSLGVIVGSAFQLELLDGVPVELVSIDTSWGIWEMFRIDAAGRSTYVSFRHGHPHRLLPHQIPYRAQAAAFREVHCGALLTTSSVGVLDTDLPLYKPLIVTDLITLENRLPDGSACTMFPKPTENHGHLVLSEGLFSRALSRQLAGFLGHAKYPERRVVFGYVGGPRTKTIAENAMWSRLGAHVNSMTVAPEVILANELEIPCCCAVVGHKYSIPGIENPEDERSVAQSLTDSRAGLTQLVRSFLLEAAPVPFGNHLYRYTDIDRRS